MYDNNEHEKTTEINSPLGTVLSRPAKPLLSDTEEVDYKVIEEEEPFETREYPAYVVAETSVKGTVETVGNKAFRPLFRYISGDNASALKIAMTAPVTQQKISKEIKVAPPVTKEENNTVWTVAFAMPAKFVMKALPAPNNPNVKLREVPEQSVAVIRYSGGWSKERYEEHLKKLQIWIKRKKLNIAGKPTWARYDSPAKPWFLRRNEILIPIAKT